MEFEEWWAKQTANFDPEEIGLMQLARVTWLAAQDVEREACAIVCDAKADNDYEAKAKAKTYDANLSNDDELRRLRHWQDVHLVNAALKRAAVAIRMRSNVEFRPTHAASSREVAPGTEG